MSASGLQVFDKTFQSTNTWLNEIGEEQGIGPDKQRAYHALRAVLWTLRDRLTPDEAFHVSAQLPMLVRGIYWDGYRLYGKPSLGAQRLAIGFAAGAIVLVAADLEKVIRRRTAGGHSPPDEDPVAAGQRAQTRECDASATGNPRTTFQMTSP